MYLHSQSEAPRSSNSVEASNHNDLTKEIIVVNQNLTKHKSASLTSQARTLNGLSALLNPTQSECGSSESSASLRGRRTQAIKQIGDGLHDQLGKLAGDR